MMKESQPYTIRRKLGFVDAAGTQVGGSLLI
jgi:hypothetical protein